MTSTSELAVLPKDRRTHGKRSAGSRRGGATRLIREECVRFFCEPMRAVFCGEANTVGNGSGLVGAYSLPTPPDDDGYYHPHHHYDDDNNNHQRLRDRGGWSRGAGAGAGGAYHDVEGGGWVSVSAWAEIWDYVGGTSYRAFVAERDGEKSLFVFYDRGVIDAELKQGLMALIELAESALGCARLVLAIDRGITRPQAQGLMKSLRWVGFEPTTLDAWADDDVDVTSEQWLFMGMEV